jgi:hypothetical protein
MKVAVYNVMAFTAMVAISIMFWIAALGSY